MGRLLQAQRWWRRDQGRDPQRTGGVEEKNTHRGRPTELESVEVVLTGELVQGPPGGPNRFLTAEEG